MQYLLMIYEDETRFGENKETPPTVDIRSQHRAFRDSIGTAFAGGAGLKNTIAATTVRTTAGAKSIHDGPFAETKEQLGGFYLIEAPDLDEAIRIAKRVPLFGDGAIEIRPVLPTG